MSRLRTRRGRIAISALGGVFVSGVEFGPVLWAALTGQWPLWIRIYTSGVVVLAFFSATNAIRKAWEAHRDSHAHAPADQR